MPPRPSDNIPAALALMFAAILLVAAMDAVAKILTATLPLPLVVWFRFVFHSLWLTPAIVFLARGRRRAECFRRRDIPGHALRGACIALATVFYFAAIADNPIPDALAVFFVEPVFVMFLAAAFLGERLRPRRIVAAAVAFAGVIVVLRPGGGHYAPTILFALAAGFCFAAYIVATRAFAMRGSPVVNAWGAAVAAMLWCAPAAFWHWQTPDGEWRMLILLGAFAASGHFFFTSACRFADASLIGIFHYAEIIAAAVVSYFLFRHIPDGGVWAGFALIAGAKIALTLAEMRGKQSGE
ncbi:MAG: DMT family transporter [Gammaproteobacteria bacterium]